MGLWWMWVPLLLGKAVFVSGDCNSKLRVLGSLEQTAQSMSDRNGAGQQAENLSFIDASNFLKNFSINPEELGEEAFNEIIYSSYRIFDKLKTLSSSNIPIGKKAIIHFANDLIRGSQRSLYTIHSHFYEYPKWIQEIFLREFFGLLLLELTFKEGRDELGDPELVREFILNLNTNIQFFEGLGLDQWAIDNRFNDIEGMGLYGWIESIYLDYIMNEGGSASKEELKNIFILSLRLGQPRTSEAIAWYALTAFDSRGKVARALLKEKQDRQIDAKVVADVLDQYSLSYEISPARRLYYDTISFLKPIARFLGILSIVQADIFASVTLEAIRRQVESTDPPEVVLIEFLKRNEFLGAAEVLERLQRQHSDAAVRKAAAEAMLLITQAYP